VDLLIAEAYGPGPVGTWNRARRPGAGTAAGTAREVCAGSGVACVGSRGLQRAACRRRGGWSVPKRLVLTVRVAWPRCSMGSALLLSAYRRGKPCPAPPVLSDAERFSVQGRRLLLHRRPAWQSSGARRRGPATTPHQLRCHPPAAPASGNGVQSCRVVRERFTQAPGPCPSRPRLCLCVQWLQSVVCLEIYI